MRIVKSIYALVLLLAIGFIAYFGVQSLAYRTNYFGYLGANLLVLSAIVALLIGVLGGRAILWLVSDGYERTLLTLCAAIAFFGYINVYNIVFPISLERSFSVRIMINLAQAPSMTLSQEDLEKRQPASRVYGLRYKEMLGSGLATMNEQGYLTLTTKGWLISQLYLGLANVLGYKNDFSCPAMENCGDRGNNE